MGRSTKQFEVLRRSKGILCRMITLTHSHARYVKWTNFLLVFNLIPLLGFSIDVNQTKWNRLNSNWVWKCSHKIDCRSSWGITTTNKHEKMRKDLCSTSTFLFGSVPFWSLSLSLYVYVFRIFFHSFALGFSYTSHRSLEISYKFNHSNEKRTSMQFCCRFLFDFSVWSTTMGPGQKHQIRFFHVLLFSPHITRISSVSVREIITYTNINTALG